MPGAPLLCALLHPSRAPVLGLAGGHICPCGHGGSPVSIGRAAGRRGRGSSAGVGSWQPRPPWGHLGSFSTHSWCRTDGPAVPRLAIRTARPLPSWVASPALLGGSLRAGDCPLGIGSPGVRPS